MTGLVFEDFKDRVGTTFTLAQEGFPPLSLVLETAEALVDHGGPAGRPPFSLILRCADPRVLQQQLYRMTQAELGEVEIFIVPVGQNATGIEYQAIFN